MSSGWSFTVKQVAGVENALAYVVQTAVDNSMTEVRCSINPRTFGIASVKKRNYAVLQVEREIHPPQSERTPMHTPTATLPACVRGTTRAHHKDSERTARAVHEVHLKYNHKNRHCVSSPRRPIPSQNQTPNKRRTKAFYILPTAVPLLHRGHKLLFPPKREGTPP